VFSFSTLTTGKLTKLQTHCLFYPNTTGRVHCTIFLQISSKVCVLQGTYKSLSQKMWGFFYENPSSVVQVSTIKPFLNQRYSLLKIWWRLSLFTKLLVKEGRKMFFHIQGKIISKTKKLANRFSKKCNTLLTICTRLCCFYFEEEFLENPAESEHKFSRK
jgi:hypothetical protein